MTARCGGGTSSNRSEFGRFVYMAPAQIGAMLNNIPTPWAVYFAGAIGSITYDLSTFCTTDPPADPNMGLEDWIALINPGTAVSSVLARSKLRDFLGHYFWDQLCKCDDGTVPTPYTPPSAPAGLPQINDPNVGPAYPTGQPCQVLTADWQLTAPNNANPGPGSTTPITAGASSVRLAVTPSRPMASGDGSGYQIIFNCFNSAGTFISNPAFYQDSASGPSGTLTANLPANTAAVRMITNVSSVASDVEVSATASIFCGSAANPGVPQPCPADPYTQIQLDQLLQLVTLIQRQAVPFAYISGADHGGLTGSGHLDVQGLLGCKVTLDSIGGGTGTEAADPDEVFEAGWITWGNADGSTKREWISHSPFVSLPALGGQYTRIGYTLRAGVSATITELVRES